MPAFGRRCHPKSATPNSCIVAVALTHYLPPMSALEEFGYTEQLSRALTTRDLVVYGMIFMVPIAPYSPFGFVWNEAKGMVPLAYLIGLIGMLFTAMSYAQMSRAFPLAGSVYTYAHRGLHEMAGFFSGWLILLDYILVPALLYLFSAVALRPIFPRMPEWLWLVGFISFNACVNLLGIQFTAKVNRYMLLMELVVLALFIILGLVALYHGAGAGGLTLRPIYNPNVFSPSLVVGATSIAVLSFLGFDGISTLAEESRGGENSVAGPSCCRWYWWVRCSCCRRGSPLIWRRACSFPRPRPRFTKLQSGRAARGCA